MRAILISIKPEYVCKILNKEKTIEIRKTMPKCELPCKVYIYCTSHNKYTKSLYLADDGEYDIDYYVPSDDDFILNSKVVAEFTLNKVEQYSYLYSPAMFISDYVKVVNDSFTTDELDYNKCCLTYKELTKYANMSDNYFLPAHIYAWYIDDLVIYDIPKELSEFSSTMKRMKGKESRFTSHLLQRPPQSWCYVEEKKDGTYKPLNEINGWKNGRMD